MCVCVYTHVCIHTPHHLYTRIHTDKRIKTVPRKWYGPYINSKGRQKVKHYNQYCWNQKKLLNADLTSIQ